MLYNLKEVINIDIKGWDFITVIDINTVNEELAKNSDLLITDFKYEKDGLSIIGKIDSWKIVSGGSDKVIRFECEFSSCSVTITNKNGVTTTYSVHGIIPELEMQLSFLNDNNFKTQLKLNLLVVGSCIGDTTDGAVTIVSPDITGKVNTQDTPELWGLLNTNLPKGFIENKDQLQYIFASISNSLDPSVSWMTPVKYTYAYKERSDNNGGYLSIFCMTSDKDIPGTGLDSSLLDDDHSIFYFISSELFMKNIMLPAITNSFKGTCTSDYNCDTNGKITLCDGKTINCDAVTYGLIDYYPVLNKLTAVLENDHILMDTSGKFDVTGLLNAYVDISAGSKLESTFNQDTQEFCITTVSHSSDYDKHIPWYDYVFAAVAGAIIALIVDGIIYFVTDSISNSVKASIETQGNFISGIPDVISWLDKNDLKVQVADLAQVLYLKI
ncbi:TULIP family P47-like protein [Ruminococcus albus]|uniref:p-47 protein n=1 Tax=Ruminococcus albus TaxID=1264 RepID=A0A1I1R5C4_RUMAL|nr:TULIP family P47-like protein [Ruminococcus albus]SFD29377.1 P-47 protein [Ruminococcus albus]